ncbi:MAG TPA: Maf family protein [Terriglobia bacterium]|nr:Maf family protein [Terriglobia bacterium]
MRLILASSSPRRQTVLREAGFAFDVLVSGVEEAQLPNETPESYVRRTARDKALAVAAVVTPPPGATNDLCGDVFGDAIVLGADTEVVVEGEILGKPRDAEDAARMLRLLSGRSHRVITGVCLARPPDRVEALDQETTLVTFRRLDDHEIYGYVRSGEPFDKAGAYAIQGLASRFVTRIEGCYFNVVGLPIALVYGLLKPFLPQ